MSTTGLDVPRREVVLEGLVEIFLTEGFAHLGVAELARRLRCSKSTLYAVAPSKEQIVTAAVRSFFRGATRRVEEQVQVSASPGTDARDRVEVYLRAIAAELAPAAGAFIADVEAFSPAREIYRRNTEAAAARVQGLMVEAQGSASGRGRVDPRFAGVVAGLVMEAIARGAITRETGLADSAAYAALSDLLVSGLR